MPYGQERWRDGAAVTDFGFTGQRNEAGFGLMDYNARYYAPGLGRFISPDTLVPDPINPAAFNRYSYVTNNPIRYNDPSGHCGPLTPLCIGVALAGLALVANASHPLPPGEAPPPEVGWIGMGMMAAPLIPQMIPAAEPYLYHYADKLSRASQTPGGQAAGNAAQGVAEGCLENCTPQNVITSAASEVIMGLNPAGFRFTTNLDLNDSKLATRQGFIAENLKLYETDAQGAATTLIPFEKRNYLYQCGSCSAAFYENFEGDRPLLFDYTYFGGTGPGMVKVDGISVGYPHRVSVSSDGLVWDVPTNTWGQNLEDYLKRVSFEPY